MKAAVWHARHDIRIEEFPDPDAPAPDEVRLRIAWCGICGTDLEEYTHGPLFIPPADRPNPITGRHAPMVIGHEFVGTVIRLGSAITDLKIGDRVAVDTLIHCGECEFCKRHQVHLCERLAIMGLMTDGGLAEFINAPRYMCFKYADGLSDAHAALAEPASVAVRSARRGRLAAGETVAIIGAGNIGLLTVEVARAMGAEKIIVLEPAAHRRQVALDLGASAAIDPAAGDPVSAVKRLTGGRGADVVFECAGITATMAMSPELAAARGPGRPRGPARRADPHPAGVGGHRRAGIDRLLLARVRRGLLRRRGYVERRGDRRRAADHRRNRAHRLDPVRAGRA